MKDIGKQFKHRKGAIFTLLCEGKHSETGEALVVLQKHKNGSIVIRPKSIFTDGRFKKIER